ncbi:hypothetical protein MPUL_16800 [Mycolicibacterium pulveris]|uniref:PE-PPE domain-containing protein n=1 Tax=Mycolicibacterium pulveris TaxID=36813 RepID=A0A7I7UGQ4_MYCPV|nr:hypothetical protein MPUL_16800 [Mycolicibacterium pulveris]
MSAAEEAVLIPGATVFKRINPFYPLIATNYPVIGIHFHDDDDPQVVDYSQNALASEWALRDGVKQADIAVRQIDGKVVVIGESMGAMVASRLAAKLAADPDAPSTDDIRFVLIAPPEAGVAEWFKEGTYIPVLNYRISRIAESPYPTTIVIGEYDGWADPPDRPWNLISSANALMGIVYVHGPPIAAGDPETLSPENTTTHTNGAGGIVTTHFVPTQNLPLTQVFRDVGVPGVLVDRVDQVVRPIVDAGYVRHDRPGDRRPYLRDGALHRNVQSQQQARAQSRESREDTVDVGEPASTGRLLDRISVDTDPEKSEKTAAEPEAPASDPQTPSESTDGDG